MGGKTWYAHDCWYAETLGDRDRHGVARQKVEEGEVFADIRRNFPLMPLDTH